MNQLVNEAVKNYVEYRSEEVGRELEATLAKLRAYRKRDPRFTKTMADFVDAEARHGKADPVEGQIVIGKLVRGRLLKERKPSGAGAAQTEIHRLLNAA